MVAKTDTYGVGKIDGLPRPRTRAALDTALVKAANTS
jgi:hypothetical protein